MSVWKNGWIPSTLDWGAAYFFRSSVFLLQLLKSCLIFSSRVFFVICDKYSPTWGTIGDISVCLPRTIIFILHPSFFILHPSSFILHTLCRVVPSLFIIRDALDPGGLVLNSWTLSNDCPSWTGVTCTNNVVTQMWVSRRKQSARHIVFYKGRKCLGMKEWGFPTFFFLTSSLG